MNGPLLLPSQEELVERLTHNVSYAEQLQLLCGEAGSGKSFLLKRLNFKINDAASILLSCPLHADDAEIRRKILLPLLSDPVFDDEISLSDSLTSLASPLKKPIVILIDDAERLSIPLWAELIGLTQIHIAGRAISVVASVIPEFEQNILGSLPEAYLSLISFVNIEPLIQQEQDALYYSLLSQSDGFENHLIAKPDFSKTCVYPKDIVNVFVQTNEEVVPNNSHKTFKSSLVLLAIVSIAAVGTAWFYQDSILSYVSHESHVSTAAVQSEPIKDDTLQLPIKSVAEVFPSNTKAPNDLSATNAEKQQQLLENNVGNIQELESQDNTSALILSSEKEQAPITTLNGTKPIKQPKLLSTETEAIDAIEQVSKEIKPVVESLATNTHKTVQPNPNFYTLQIATVSKEKSLNNLLKQLSGYSNVRVGRYKSNWVVLVGEFENRAQAKTFEAKLDKETRLPKPWIRKWKALSNVELQNPHKDSEK